MCGSSGWVSDGESIYSSLTATVDSPLKVGTFTWVTWQYSFSEASSSSLRLLNNEKEQTKKKKQKRSTEGKKDGERA